MYVLFKNSLSASKFFAGLLQIHDIYFECTKLLRKSTNNCDKNTGGFEIPIKNRFAALKHFDVKQIDIKDLPTHSKVNERFNLIQKTTGPKGI